MNERFKSRFMITMILAILVFIGYIVLNISSYIAYTRYSDGTKDLGKVTGFSSLQRGEHVNISDYYVFDGEVLDRNSYKVYSYCLVVMDDLNKVAGVVEFRVNDQEDPALIAELESMKGQGFDLEGSRPLIDGHIENIKETDVSGKLPSDDPVLSGTDLTCSKRVVAGQLEYSVRNRIGMIIVSCFTVSLVVLCVIMLKRKPTQEEN